MSVKFVEGMKYALDNLEKVTLKSQKELKADSIKLSGILSYVKDMRKLIERAERRNKNVG